MYLSSKSILLAIIVCCCLKNIRCESGSESPQNKRVRVAVVGSGVGGSAAAYFIRNLTGNSVDVHVFEKNSRVGGRVYSFQYENQTYELGASIIHKENRYAVELANEMGLKTVKPGDGDSLLAIFNGTDFVFTESKYSLVNYAKLIWRYGLTPLQFRQLGMEMLGRFKQFYDLQANWTSFESPVEMLQAVGLYNLTQYTFRDVYYDFMGKSTYGSQAFLEEILGAVNRVNYNQNNSLNALAGLVSNMASSSDVLVHIQGGNQQLPEKLLQSATKLDLSADVQEIIQLESGKFELTVKDQETKLGPFDVVIIATPLSQTKINIQLSNQNKLPYIPPQKFRACISTYVKGELRGRPFKSEKQIVYKEVLVTEKADTFFQSIAFKTKLADNSSLYKVFSTEPLSQKQVDQLFEKGEVVTSENWMAYPHFQPPEEFSPYVLAPGLIYDNALESAVSAMEVSMVSARNAAILAAKYLGYQYQEQKKFDQQQQQQSEL
eukprot:TRINITY_DN335_c0_g1_i3.p1 TRINITY_DN335_c0_g1~~TRINITY_DN335_c0_g1_i3.p1  ORF type:complete len:492 (+),score=57.82 TRINITY_DN335_c0_g1_i3:62-1537(+)